MGLKYSKTVSEIRVSLGYKSDHYGIEIWYTFTRYSTLQKV